MSTSRPRGPVAFALSLSMVVVACGGTSAGSAVATFPAVASAPAAATDTTGATAPGAAASSGASPTPAPTPTPTLEPTPAESVSAILDGVPTACWSLGPGDCRRVVANVAGHLTATDPAIVYVQVGAFGCRDGERCPATLAARPQGDVFLETGSGLLSFHVTALDDGGLQVDRQDAFWIPVPPTSRPPVPGGPVAYTLGHCGLWSGIDLGGSWWSPVGPVDGDHPDSINGADGVIAFLGTDRATFTSEGGLAVQLVRRPEAAQQYLPPCM